MEGRGEEPRARAAQDARAQERAPGAGPDRAAPDAGAGADRAEPESGLPADRAAAPATAAAPDPAAPGPAAAPEPAAPDGGAGREGEDGGEGGAGRWLLSAAYVVQVYAMMALMALWFTPWAIVDRRGAHAGVRSWCRYARWSARRMVGLETQVRGPVPTGEALIAAKHQSFLDIILIVSEVPRPKFVMKAELRRTPILGWYAGRIGCVPVHRGRRAEAVRRMLADVEAGRADPGQLIIYPQGTRTAPGEHRSYKPGAAALYAASGQPCVPAACNVGLFWPRRGVMRRPGLAVVEFLPPIEPGLAPEAFLERLEREVEGASERLMAEAGWRPGRGG